MVVTSVAVLADEKDDVVSSSCTVLAVSWLTYFVLIQSLQNSFLHTGWLQTTVGMSGSASVVLAVIASIFVVLEYSDFGVLFGTMSVIANLVSVSGSCCWELYFLTHNKISEMHDSVKWGLVSVVILCIGLDLSFIFLEIYGGLMLTFFMSCLFAVLLPLIWFSNFIQFPSFGGEQVDVLLHVFGNFLVKHKEAADQKIYDQLHTARKFASNLQGHVCMEERLYVLLAGYAFVVHIYLSARLLEDNDFNLGFLTCFLMLTLPVVGSLIVSKDKQLSKEERKRHLNEIMFSCESVLNMIDSTRAQMQTLKVLSPLPARGNQPSSSSDSVDAVSLSRHCGTSSGNLNGSESTKLAELTSKIQDLQKQEHRSREEVSRYISMVDRQRGEIEVKNRKISQLEEQNRDLKQVNSQLSTQLTSSKSTSSDINGSHVSLKASHSSGKEQAGQDGSRAGEHEKQVEALSMQVEELRKRVSETEAERVQAQLSSEREVVLLRSELGLSERSRTQLEAEASSLRVKAAELEALLSQSNTKLEEALKSLKETGNCSREEQVKGDGTLSSSPIHVNRVLLGAGAKEGSKRAAFTSPRISQEGQKEGEKSQEGGELAAVSSPVAAVEHLNLEQLEASKDDSLWCF
uniref:Uncharacterized protein n=1 Tax=Hanusia phi TaxID=3032 RepID=A0A7S0I3D9_9CRYP